MKMTVYDCAKMLMAAKAYDRENQSTDLNHSAPPLRRSGEAGSYLEAQDHFVINENEEAGVVAGQSNEDWTSVEAGAAVGFMVGSCLSVIGIPVAAVVLAAAKGKIPEKKALAIARVLLVFTFPGAIVGLAGSLAGGIVGGFVEAGQKIAQRIKKRHKNEHSVS